MCDCYLHSLRVNEYYFCFFVLFSLMQESSNYKAVEMFLSLSLSLIFLCKRRKEKRVTPIVPSRILPHTRYLELHSSPGDGRADFRSAVGLGSPRISPRKSCPDVRQHIIFCVCVF